MLICMVLEILLKYIKKDFKVKKAFALLEIDFEKFYNLWVFFYNLKSNNINFCFCFISDVIEDKLENRIGEKIKLFINDDKDINKNLKIKEEKVSEENKINMNDVKEINKNIKIKRKKLAIKI